ncbi:MAG: hypothetical protein ABIP89_17455 [Polyangiaceae bacterium]
MLLACVVGLGTWACSLNPQPIPPGFSENGDSDAGRSSDAATGPFNGLDGAGGGFPDSGMMPAPMDGGEDAMDASIDAPSDAPDDGG